MAKFSWPGHHCWSKYERLFLIYRMKTYQTIVNFNKGLQLMIIFIIDLHFWFKSSHVEKTQISIFLGQGQVNSSAISY